MILSVLYDCKYYAGKLYLAQTQGFYCPYKTSTQSQTNVIVPSYTVLKMLAFTLNGNIHEPVHVV